MSKTHHHVQEMCGLWEEVVVVMSPNVFAVLLDQNTHGILTKEMGGMK
jgi:hypothetical protein